MTVVKSKLQAFAACMTPPGKPNNRNSVSSFPEQPVLAALHIAAVDNCLGATASGRASWSNPFVLVCLAGSLNHAR